MADREEPAIYLPLEGTPTVMYNVSSKLQLDAMDRRHSYCLFGQHYNSQHSIRALVLDASVSLSKMASKPEEIERNIRSISIETSADPASSCSMLENRLRRDPPLASGVD